MADEALEIWIALPQSEYDGMPILLEALAPGLVMRGPCAWFTHAQLFGGRRIIFQSDFQEVDFPLFLMPKALVAWYQGTGPAILALVLSTVAFNYYFTEPLHTLYFTRSEVPYYVMFILFGSLVAWFSAVRRRVELELLRARDELQAEVIERTQQASLLHLTHDAIFVRDMSYHHVLESMSRGAVWMDAGAGNWEAIPRPVADRFSGGARRHQCRVAATLGRGT